MKSHTTIVTAYFDIGKGDWTTAKGFKKDVSRTSDVYFSYFENLAALENEMVVFTSHDLKPRIEAIRSGKPTTVIVVDVKNKFKNIRKRIENIQKSENFRNKLSADQLSSPEYWSADYVLVCNLKAYFVNEAIKLGLVKTPQVAWVDFGYCRKPKVTRGLKRWDFPFDENKIHLFSIQKGLQVTSLQQAFEFMITNNVFIIGGAIVGSSKKWKEFYALVVRSQRITLSENIVDDDQGIFVMCYYQRPDLFRINYLGRRKWFDLFRCFRKTKLGSKLQELRIYLTKK